MSTTETFAFEPDGGERKPASSGGDIVFSFTGFRLLVEFPNGVDGFDEDTAREELSRMAESVWIDRTYVKYAGTKYRSAFLREDGWEILIAYMACSAGGLREQIVMRSTFESMIVAYMEHAAFLLGYDPSGIRFSVDPDSEIRVRIFADTYQEWKRYPGRWQDWPGNK